MSLKRTKLGLVLVFIFGNFNTSLCENLDKAELVLAKDSGEIEGTIFIANGTSLEVKESDENDYQLVSGLTEESRKKKQDKNQKSFAERILPKMIIPFMVSTAIIPIMLISLKILVLKSAFLGKIAILMILLNMFRRRTNGEGGVFNHNVNVNDPAMEHYGYHGGDEYGAYVNRRRRKRRCIS